MSKIMNFKELKKIVLNFLRIFKTPAEVTNSASMPKSQHGVSATMCEDVILTYIV